jgi:phage-related minor tail protein
MTDTPLDQSLTAAGDALAAFAGGPVQSATSSIETAVKRSFSSVENTIARAAGGPVDAGTPYLVGEQGPELFVPGSAGAIAPNSALGGRASVTVNVTTPDAQSFLKSESQVAAMLSRALARGQRNL